MSSGTAASRLATMEKILPSSFFGTTLESSERMMIAGVDDINPTQDPVLASVAYRKHLPQALFYKVGIISFKRL